MLFIFKTSLMVLAISILGITDLFSISSDSNQFKEEKSDSVSSSLLIERNQPIEYYLSYLIESSTRNSYINFGLLSNYDISTNRNVSVLIDINFLCGFNGAKNQFIDNFLAGIRHYAIRRNNVKLFIDISSGLGFANKIGSNTPVGIIYSRLRFGFDYKSIGLRFSLSTYTGTNNTVAPIYGLGISFTL